MENCNQKVYINPNFNRTGTHFNKHFTHATNLPVQQNKTKIFVNPNFLPTQERKQFQAVQSISLDNNTLNINNFYQCPQNYNLLNNSSMFNNTQSFSIPKTVNPIQEQYEIYKSNEHNNSKHLVNHSQHNYIEPTMVKSKYSLVRNTNLVQIPLKQEVRSHINQETQKEISVNCTIIPKNNSVAEKKSRYSIIRNNTNMIRNTIDISMNCIAVKNNTVKISKYKRTTISSLKKELQTVPDTKNKFSYQTVKENIPLQKNKLPSSSLLKVSPKQNKYKYKRVEGNRKKADVKDIKLNSSINRSVYKQSKNKTLIRKYKINNILCSLFVKYGKCLRKLNGTCEYLHDKKHVSLCRKFIKGRCHDTSCLLSHELSAKKMPTCYFYLKGMCTKENCPYLHVKLSSKSKICQHFLRGYCEKGENCLERHVLQPTSKKKIIQKNMQPRVSPKDVQKFRKGSKISKTQIKEEENKINSQQSESDQRYFKDAVDPDEECQAIKPIRCQLGILPSYIHLL